MATTEKSSGKYFEYKELDKDIAQALDNLEYEIIKTSWIFAALSAGLLLIGMLIL